MINHIDHTAHEIHRFIRNKTIRLAGNKMLKIFGTLHCVSGKRMKKEHRVFFSNVAEAHQLGFRPCGHCMREDYHQWKSAKSGLSSKID